MGHNSPDENPKPESVPPADWKKYTGSQITFPNSEWFWQKRLYDFGNGNTISAEIVEYGPIGESGPMWEVQIYFASEISPIIGKAVNVKVYTYDELNFPKMEEDARKVCLLLVGILGTWPLF